MALDVNRLLDELDDARESTLALIDKFKKIADTAQLFDGVIAETIPLNIKKDIEIISNLSEGEEQNSLTKLTELVENIPIGQVRSRKAVKATLDLQGTKVAGTESTVDQIDTTPNTEVGNQSAIAAETAQAEPTRESALSAYLKQGKLEEQKARYIANTINLGQTLEGIQEDSPYGQSMNELVSPDLHYDLSKVLEGNSNAMAIGANFDNSLQSSMRRVAANKANYQRMHEGEAPAETPSWRKAASTVHMNESHNGFEGMFGGAAPKPIADRGALIENMSFDDIFAGGVADGSNSVHIVDNAYNK